MDRFLSLALGVYKCVGASHIINHFILIITKKYYSTDNYNHQCYFNMNNVGHRKQYGMKAIEDMKKNMKTWIVCRNSIYNTVMSYVQMWFNIRYLERLSSSLGTFIYLILIAIVMYLIGETVSSNECSVHATCS